MNKAINKPIEQPINQHQHTITQYMYLGLLPFFAGAFGPWIFADYEQWLSQSFLLYSTIILSFLSGALWAVALFLGLPKTPKETSSHSRYIHAAIGLSLIPFFSYFMPALYHTAVLLLGFLALLFWEKLFINHHYPRWYQQLRHKITFIVATCHMLVIWNLIRA